MTLEICNFSLMQARQHYENYTPHNVCVRTIDDKEHNFPSKGSARLTESQELLGVGPNGIALRKTTYGHIEGLPEPRDDTFIIVSILIKQANDASLNPRTDLITPDMGKTCIRENGIPKAVTGFLV